MTIWQAIVLGIVQGLTEFMPISSSAHLIIVPQILGWQDPGLTFDVALHMGTLIAVLIYFWSDLIQLALGWVRTIRERRLTDQYGRLAWILLIGCIPGGIAGVLLEKAAETALRDLRIIATATILLAVVLFAADRLGRGRRTLDEVTLRDGIVIGFAQALALIPGVSRSGATITAGLARGLQRDTAARFSFLIGTPIIAGAGAFQFLKTVKGGLPADERAGFAAGMIASAIVGYFTIAFLLRFLRRRTTLPFVIYRIALGIFLFVWVAGGH